jgi:flagellar hook assembly protein FlgD
MREDGTIVDKVVVTNDVDFVPSGEGPAESPQVTAPATSAKANADEFSKAGIAGDEVQLPTEYALNGNYPNPFNPTTTISYDLPEASSVRLEVYDMMGRRVATLVNADQGAGSYETVWNARNDAGSPVASGVYIYRIQAGSFQAVQQMVLMK